MPPKRQTGYFAIVAKPPTAGLWVHISGAEVGGPYANAHELLQALPSLMWQYRADRRPDAPPLGNVTLIRQDHSGLVAPDGWDEWRESGRASGQAEVAAQPEGADDASEE